MYGDTDHDHVGKLITYAAGLEAGHAVLLAENFRPEHRTALNWLNRVSTEDCAYFGLVLEAWRIDDSPGQHRTCGSRCSRMIGRAPSGLPSRAVTANSTLGTSSSGPKS